ncbi:hypothetical protein SteCoe_32 [Stentor coeruleus]|uniref:Protein kinase domain-containing protein n=1 Tax=Stentor coeruleus TaxID=5963 RepID=A0A1R2D4V6_9CILI|nr:hypothetical protein SteCoe_32 [Stentor coeruleus]
MLSVGQKICFSSGDIEVTKLLHKKSTSLEYLCQSDSSKYLLRVIRMPTPQLQELYYQEFTNQKLIPPDPHIIAFYDHSIIKSPNEIGLFKLEYGENGTLKDFLKNHELNEEQILYIFKDILLATIKINDSGIVHRDISPANIWIDQNYSFKLSSFERSLRVDDNRQTNLAINIRRINHPALRPPEYLEGPVLNKFDIWGLGCLLYYLIYREYPINNDKKRCEASSHLENLLNLCLEPNPDDRPLPRMLLNMLANYKIPSFPLEYRETNVEGKCIRYSAESSIFGVLNRMPIEPDLFFLQQITFVSWGQIDQIPNLFKVVMMAEQGFTLIAVKSLIIVHRLLLSGPKEILCKEMLECLEKISALWTNKVPNPEDTESCEYFSGLIRQLTKILIDKVKFHLNTNTLGNWKCQIKLSDIPETINYLGRVIRICEGLSMGKDILPAVNSFLAMQLIEECQRLINCISSMGKALEVKSYTDRLSILNFEPTPPKLDAYKSMNVPKINSTKDLKNIVSATPKKNDEDFNVREMSPNNVNRMGKTADGFGLKNKDEKKPLLDDGMFADLMDLQAVGIKSPKVQMRMESENKRTFSPAYKQQQKTGESTRQNFPQIHIPNSSNMPNPLQAPLINQSPIIQNAPNIPPINNNLLPNLQVPNINYLPSPNQSNNPSQNHPRNLSPNIPANPCINISSPKNQKPSNSTNNLPKVIFQNPLPEIIQAPEAIQKKNLSNQNLNPSHNLSKAHSHSNSANIPSEILQKPKEIHSKQFTIEKRWIIKHSDIKLGNILGAGASCTVYRGEYKRTPVAVKMMRESYSGQNIVQEFQREVSAMVTLRHPNLVLFMGANVEPNMMIISEFCAGESMFKLLHEKKNVQLHWRQKLKMIIDVARGMLYLHEANPPILHRDLKSLNLLLLDEVNSPNDFILVKITDFGIARIIEEEEARLTVRMGTCHWMAPEVMNSEPYSLAADVYSFGIVVWEIVARETPYRGMNSIDISMRVLRGERPDINAIGPSVPVAIKDLIKSCWDQNPARRPTFRQIMQFLEGLPGASEF